MFDWILRSLPAVLTVAFFASVFAGDFRLILMNAEVKEPLDVATQRGTRAASPQKYA
jgi:hypothetical protein